MVADVAAIEALDLTAYLRETARIGIVASRRGSSEEAIHEEHEDPARQDEPDGSHDMEHARSIRRAARNQEVPRSSEERGQRQGQQEARKLDAVGSVCIAERTWKEERESNDAISARSAGKCSDVTG